MADRVDEVDDSESIPLLPDDEESQHDVVIHVPEETARTAEIGIVSILILIILAASAVAIIVFVLDRRRQKKIEECVDKLEKTEEGKTMDPLLDQTITESATASEVDEPPPSDLTTTTPSLTNNVNNNRDRNANAALNRRQRRCCMCFCCPPTGEPSLEDIWKQKKQQQKNENARASYGSRTARESLKLMEKGMRQMEKVQNFLKLPKPSASTTEVPRSKNRHRRHRSDGQRAAYGEQVSPPDASHGLSRRASYAGNVNKSCWSQAHSAVRTRSKSRDPGRRHGRQQQQHHHAGRVSRSLSRDVWRTRSRSLDAPDKKERERPRSRFRSQSRACLHHHRHQQLQSEHRHHPEPYLPSSGGRSPGQDTSDGTKARRQGNYNVNWRDHRSTDEVNEVNASRVSQAERLRRECRASSKTRGKRTAEFYSDETSSHYDNDSDHRISSVRQYSDDSVSPVKTSAQFDLSRRRHSRSEQTATRGFENRNYSANRSPQQFRHSTPNYPSRSAEVHPLPPPLPPLLPPPPPPLIRTIPRIYQHARGGPYEAGPRPHSAPYHHRYGHLNVSQNYNCEDSDLASSARSTTSTPVQWMTPDERANTSEEAENDVSDEGSGAVTSVSEKATLISTGQRGDEKRSRSRIRISKHKSPQFLRNSRGLPDGRQSRRNDDSDESTSDDSSHGKAETVSLAEKLFGLKLVSRKRLHRSRPGLSRKKRRRAERRPLLGSSLGSSSSDSEDTTYEASKGTEPAVGSGSALSATLPVDSGYDMSGSFPSEPQRSDEASAEPSTMRCAGEMPRQGNADVSPLRLVGDSCVLSVRRRRKNGGANRRGLSPILPACDFRATPVTTGSLDSCARKERRGEADSGLLARAGNVVFEQSRGRVGDSFSTGQTTTCSLIGCCTNLKPADLHALANDADDNRQFRMLATQRWCEQQRRPQSNPASSSDVASPASPQPLRDVTPPSRSPHTLREGSSRPFPIASSDITDVVDEQRDDSWTSDRVCNRERSYCHRSSSSALLKERRGEPRPESAHRDNGLSSACGPPRRCRIGREELAMLCIAQGKELPREVAFDSEVDFMDFQTPLDSKVGSRENRGSGRALRGDSMPQQFTVSIAGARAPPDCSSDSFGVLAEEKASHCHEEKKADLLYQSRCDIDTRETRAVHSPLSSQPVQGDGDLRNPANTAASTIRATVVETDTAVVDNQMEPTVSPGSQSNSPPGCRRHCEEDKSPMKCVFQVETSRTMEGTLPRADKQFSSLSPSVLPLCALHENS